MREIAKIQNPQAAEILADYLYLQGIENTLREEEDGVSLWVHDDDEIEAAIKILQDFLANPQDPRFVGALNKAKEQRLKQRQAERQSRYRPVNARTQLMAFNLKMPPVTLSLIIISVLVALVSQLGNNLEPIRYFFITEKLVFPDWSFNWSYLPEVSQGQVWRLLTPIFIHFGFLHIIFNMLWLKDLGTVIENRLGWKIFLAQVFVMGVASNVAQFLVSGPLFGGMSGVVYGLLGFLWIRGHFDPRLGLRLNQGIVVMMLVWLGIGYVGALFPSASIISNMANTAHTVGLFSGMAWGYLSAMRRK